MEPEKVVLDLWNDIDKQNWGNLPDYFSPTAVVNWHNTNERFSVSEFVLANSRYPGDWRVEVEKLMKSGDIVISVVKVSLGNEDTCFHATSFFTFQGDKIEVLDEYWGSDDAPPQWRVDMKLGRPIR